jgi:hypothetical protein
MATVKKAKTDKRKGGRPFGVPEDRRTERLAIRCHPDLVAALSDVARKQGFVRSVLIERTLIDLVNRFFGAPVVDAIGRNMQQSPAPLFYDRRGHQAVDHSISGSQKDHPSRRLKEPKK